MTGARGYADGAKSAGSTIPHALTQQGLPAVGNLHVRTDVSALSVLCINSPLYHVCVGVYHASLLSHFTYQHDCLTSSDKSLLKSCSPVPGYPFTVLEYFLSACNSVKARQPHSTSPAKFYKPSQDVQVGPETVSMNFLSVYTD